ncbi:hypothetical protein TL16_g13280, partial [Triparma laevis f. inornata]
MSQLFYNKQNFNDNISGWDVSLVTNMEYMFFYASVFNQDLSGWDVSSVTTIRSMFGSASVFNQDLNKWNVCKVTNFDYMFYASGMSGTDLSSLKSNCVNCPSGKYSGSGEFVSPEGNPCTGCVAGKYNDSPGAETCTICAAGSYSGSALTSCTVCPAGKYNPDQATSASLHVPNSCTACSPGTKLEDRGTDAERHNADDDCELCGPGYYSNDEEGSASCSPCPDGEVSPAGASACSSCPAGYECVRGTTTPCATGKYSEGGSNCGPCEKGYRCPGGTDRQECLPGSHQSAVSSSTCFPCEAGKFQQGRGMETCDDCLAGYFCPERTVNPVACGSVALFCEAEATIVAAASSGYYTTPATEEASTTRTSQTICEVGFACVGGVKTSCNGPGQYADETGLSACKSAPAGKKPTSDRQHVESCPLGKFSLGGQDECTPCDGEGQYADETGLSACKSAPAGKKPTSDRQNVENCPAGTYSTGATDIDGCKECPAGEHSLEGSGYCQNCPQYMEYSETENKCVCMDSFTRGDGDGNDGTCTCEPGFTLTGKSCSACEIGRYKEDHGVHSCSRCEDVLKRSVTTSENSTDIGACACPAGKYNSMEKSCVDVDEGVDGLTPSMTLATLKLEPGYWRTGTTSIDIRECPITNACIGGNNST